MKMHNNFFNHKLFQLEDPRSEFAISNFDSFPPALLYRMHRDQPLSSAAAVPLEGWDSLQL